MSICTCPPNERTDPCERNYALGLCRAKFTRALAEERAAIRVAALEEEGMSDDLYRFADTMRAFPYGTRVRKTKGAMWSGRVVGYYTTALNPYGLAVESDAHPGSVQIYPTSMLTICGE